jgi:hypothetical protein
MTHTPGPWVIGRANYGVLKKTDAIGVIADGDHGYTICDVFGDVEELAPHMRANAHLIAAAPDYHAAVSEALTRNDGYNCEYVSIPVKAWRMILAAHAKAEGRAELHKGQQ